MLKIRDITFFFYFQCSAKDQRVRLFFFNLVEEAQESLLVLQETLGWRVDLMGSRSVEYPNSESEESEIELPDMMFADSEEPVGVRVLTYQSSRAINNILNALHEEEIQYLRSTPFGKIVEIADKPAFSGRFARFLLSRQLKVEKKHEAWFRFAGKPIRFSLREFAIVTGLPCGEIPTELKAKKKRSIKDKPYWSELFGTVEDMTVLKSG